MTAGASVTVTAVYTGSYDDTKLKAQADKGSRGAASVEVCTKPPRPCRR